MPSVRAPPSFTSRILISLARDMIGLRTGCYQISILQPAGRARNLVLGSFAHDFALVYDRDMAAKPLDFLEIMRGEKNSAAVFVDLGQITPEHPAQLHIHTCGGLV